MALIRLFDIQKSQRWSSHMFWWWLPGLLESTKCIHPVDHWSIMCCVSVSRACWAQMYNRCGKCPTTWAHYIYVRRPVYSSFEVVSKWGTSSCYQFTTVFRSHFWIGFTSDLYFSCKETF